MSVTDAGFLYLDKPHAALNIGSVVILEGQVSALDVAARVRERIHHMWRYAQRPVAVPLGLGHPGWEDDPRFEVEAHLREWSLLGSTGPGAAFELNGLVARLLAEPLERNRPLWELHVIAGLEADRSAVLIKVHHCMVDGMGAVQLIEELMTSEPRPPGLGNSNASVPRPAIGSVKRARSAIGDGLMRRARRVGALADSLRRPAQARRAAEKLLGAAYSTLKLATHDIPRLPWNAPIGRERRLSFTQLPMAGVRRIRDQLGGTLNDVVLCVLAGGLRRYLQAVGISCRAGELTALVPVSMRDASEASTLGNRISAMLVPLAVDLDGEAARLGATRAITGNLKSALAWTGIDALLQLLEELPAPLVSLVAPTLNLSRIANLIATNVPGPRETRYLCCREVEAIYPIVPIADGIGLGLAVFSYAGTLYVGLNGDAERVPDLEKLRQAIEESFQQLLASA